MKGGLKRGKRNLNTLESQKKQAKDEWNTAFHNFKKKEVMNGRVCSMNQKTACLLYTSYTFCKRRT